MMPDKAIAYHEAGHAVVAMNLGYECWCVSIVPNERGDPGRVNCQDPRKLEQGTQEQRFKHYIIIVLAGAIAERRCSRGAKAHDGFDMADIINAVIEHTSRKETEDVYAAIIKALPQTRPLAENLVEQHWAEIEALAQRLLIEKTVLLNRLARAEN